MDDFEKQYADMVSNFSYVVRKTTYRCKGSIRCKKVIALQDDRTGLLEQITDYADYLIYMRDADMGFEASNDAGLYAVCQFLNFVLIKKFSQYQIKGVEELTVQMVKDFLQQYAHSYTKQGKHPSKNSVRSKRDNISVFLAMLSHYKKTEMRYIRKEDIIGTEYIQSPEHLLVKVNHYKIKVRYGSANNNSSLMRDMPLEIVERFIKMSQIYEPELTFAFVLMAYGGLREGEVCNVRRKDSCYGPGVIISYSDGINEAKGTYERCHECTSMELDLLDTLVLRSDGKRVGEIKRERKQGVYSGYVDLIYNYYERHLRIIAFKECEEYKPMFITKYKNKQTGKYMALTKASLRDRINRLFKEHVLPSLASDKNQKLQTFYAQMMNYSWGAHAFRHWFTVSLVLLGCDEVVIQSARGDRNRNSSKIYLERKGELQNLYKSAADILGTKIRSEETEWTDT